MNLFCFTLEGSTESIYEPAHTQKLKEVLPKYQCSPVLLRRKAEWGGSDPSVISRPQGKIKSKRDIKRSCVPTSALDNETFEKDNHHTCWMSCSDKKGLFHQTKVQKGETCEAPRSKPTAEGRGKDPSSDTTRADLPAQGAEAAADTAEPTQTAGRLKKLQNLVQAKKGHQNGSGKGKRTSGTNNHLAQVVGNGNPVLTCIGRGRTERKPSKTALPSQQLPQQQAGGPHKDEEDVGSWSPRTGNHPWSPFDCPQTQTYLYHTCHRPRHELCMLRQTTEWDRFESLIQELDRKQSDRPPPQMIHSITDLHLYQNTLTRFERFEALRQRSPLMEPQDNGSCLTREQNGEPARSRLLTSEDRKQVEASPEETQAVLTDGDIQRGETERRESCHGRTITEAHRRSSNSLESLYSLNSGQSSSSGVTSGSDCSSNRNSLRLEDDMLCTRQFCGRARVHTEYVPSPYDTESLKLKVGDVIDIIAKPPMGIWRGILNGRIGNFKFIYVDVLRKESSGAHLEAHTHRMKHTSTVREVLRRLSLEDYSTCLQLGGYQTVDDLMRLREHHLMELNVTDPEHRRRLLTAVDSLRQLCSDRRLENEDDQEAERSSEKLRADANNCARDSGCHMPSDSPDSIAEDADLLSLAEHLLPADVTAP